MALHRILIAFMTATGLALAGCATQDNAAIVSACGSMAAGGLRPLAIERTDRFEGKVQEDTARCRGGARAVAGMGVPWVYWRNYWATADSSSRAGRFDSGSHIFDRNIRGIDGTLLDLEYQRMELIRFNLFDNLTFSKYAGRTDGPTMKVWPEMRLPASDPAFLRLAVSSDGSQRCRGAVLRGRTLTGICNDPLNPAMGATGQLFGRNVDFEATSPELGLSPLVRNRHGDRLGLLTPDPQLVSRLLFTRDQKDAVACNQGHGDGTSATAQCPYRKAPFFNVLAAFWIQFMTHDWFSHLDNARGDLRRPMESLGCTGNARASGCRPGDHIEAALLADDGAPPMLRLAGTERMARAPRTSRNFNTAWWDASQIYGFDENSARRVKRDTADHAKLLLRGDTARVAEAQGYLPVFAPACPSGQSQGCDPIRGEWTGQEAAAFADNWSIGMSLYHTVFTREHNAFVDAFRVQARATPNADSGLRDPDAPGTPIPYRRVGDEELFAITRLVIAAEIAKIHTIEWTTQLLYDEPLNLGMNSNWSGLFEKGSLASRITSDLVAKLSQLPDQRHANQIYSALAAGAGIVGLGQTNHFGVPFNFPEEFVSVYRLHPLVPDLIEMREVANPNAIAAKVAVIDTFRGKATDAMHAHGLADWALSMGRQRLGLLTLRNTPQFMQNLDLRPRIDSHVDVAALDLIRDREHGVPRFNEFRRQLGLRSLTGFDDFIDANLPQGPARAEQEEIVRTLRRLYGQHVCDDSKLITDAQRRPDGRPITDCLGRPNGSLVDNVEDVDIVVGYLAETTRPHGFAISETQFQVFILNASRRLFSDRFFTESFRPAYYSQFGLDWVNNNGPGPKQVEQGLPNGHRQEVSPLKRVLLRTIPELGPELAHVVNAFDPWARDRGGYYSLDWKPRPDAANDPAFAQP